VIIDGVAAHGPANGKLFKGDVIVAVDKLPAAIDESGVKMQVCVCFWEGGGGGVGFMV
jgi:hypothetical protein